MGTLIRPKNGACWWCRAPADSREHRYKRSDLVREFGNPPYEGGQALVVVGGSRRNIRGPNSDAFKFGASLCRRCNNERSQPFDLAYDRFVEHLATHRNEILKARAIDLPDVYGASWRTEALQLVRYYAKHIGCRIADNVVAHGLGVDEDLIAFLDGGAYPPGLHLDPCIDSGLQAVDRVLSAGAAVTGKPDDGFLSAGPLFTEMSVSTGVHQAPQACLRYRWFTLYWQVDDRGQTGNPFDAPVVGLRRTDEVTGLPLRARLRLRAWLYRVPRIGAHVVRVRTSRVDGPRPKGHVTKIGADSE